MQSCKLNIILLNTLVTLYKSGTLLLNSPWLRGRGGGGRKWNYYILPLLSKGWNYEFRQCWCMCLLTTGLCTSQKALSWLSRIFLSILSLFLSTLLTSQQWRVSSVNHSASVDKRPQLEQIFQKTHKDSLCLCFCLHKNELPLPGKCSL